MLYDPASSWAVLRRARSVFHLTPYQGRRAKVRRYPPLSITNHICAGIPYPPEVSPFTTNSLLILIAGRTGLFAKYYRLWRNRAKRVVSSTTSPSAENTWRPASDIIDCNIFSYVGNWHLQLITVFLYAFRQYLLQSYCWSWFKFWRPSEMAWRTLIRYQKIGRELSVAVPLVYI
jgi:hypothetical protein